MSVITTSKATERLSRKLQRAGLNCWIARAVSDIRRPIQGGCEYQVFFCGGAYVGSAGYSLRDVESKVNHMIKYKNCEEAPPWM